MPRPVNVVQPNDRIAVIAPSGPFDRTHFEKGLALLQARYQVDIGPAAYSSHRYLAGTDEQRADDLRRALEDHQLKAIVAARGGYGAARLLPTLPSPLPRAVPIVGFSDITALHAHWASANLRSLHAPVVTQLGIQPDDIVQRFFAALEGKTPAPIQGSFTVTPGLAEGPLFGGNLSVLASLIGTRFFPSLRGAILLLEDLGERPYRLDRLWTQLRLSGALDDLAGIVLGDFTNCEEKDARYTSEEVLRSLVAERRVPCASGFPIGHALINTPVVLGARVRLDANAQTLTHLEGLTA